MGPGGKITGEYISQFNLKGFVLEARSTEKAGMGETRFHEIDAYDAASKSITSNGWGDDGSRFTGVITVVGNTITWDGKFVFAGTEFGFKGMKFPDFLALDVRRQKHAWINRVVF